MSLILRKACQGQLNTVGLDDYHVRVCEDFRYLEIVGPCGKPLFSISGIKFSKITPNMEEIDYAGELLAEFFLSHKEKLDTFFSTQKAASALKEVEKPEGITFYDVTGGYRVDYDDPETTNELMYFYPQNQFHYKQKSKMNLKDCGDLLKDKELIKVMKSKAKQYAKYMDTVAAFDAARRDVQTCNI